MTPEDLRRIQAQLDALSGPLREVARQVELQQTGIVQALAAFRDATAQQADIGNGIRTALAVHADITRAAQTSTATQGAVAGLRAVAAGAASVRADMLGGLEALSRALVDDPGVRAALEDFAASVPDGLDLPEAMGDEAVDTVARATGLSRATVRRLVVGFADLMFVLYGTWAWLAEPELVDAALDAPGIAAAAKGVGRGVGNGLDASGLLPPDDPT